MSEAPPSVTTELPVSHEHLAPQEELVGLQVRLLISKDALNHQTQLPQIEQSMFHPLAERIIEPDGTYFLLNRASINERKDWWQKQEIRGFDEQKKAWAERTAAAFQNAQRFFETSDKGIHWKQAFARIGINTHEFTQTQAEQLYNTFFASPAQETGVQHFIAAILQSYQTGENSIDYQRLHEDLPAWQWLAGIFGDKSSQIIAQLTDAEVKLKTQPQILIDGANQAADREGEKILRVNNLEDKEKELLIFLLPNGQAPATAETATPPLTQTPEAETKPQQEQKIPNVNVGENIRAANQFIQVLRDPSRYKEDPNDNNFIIHNLGYRVDKSTPLENVWFSTQSLEVAGQRHKLPLAMLIEANHAMLLLKTPYKSPDGNWRILIYNPFKEGEEERILPNYEQTDDILTDPQVPEQYKTKHRLELNNIRANDLAVAQIHQGQYDISVSGNPKLKSYQEMFMQGKLAHLQQDAKNCIPYCHFVGALLNALKPGDSEFKRIGIPQFAQDFGIRIRTLEEILNEKA